MVKLAMNSSRIFPSLGSFGSALGTCPGFGRNHALLEHLIIRVAHEIEMENISVKKGVSSETSASFMKKLLQSNGNRFRNACRVRNGNSKNTIFSPKTTLLTR